MMHIFRQQNLLNMQDKHNSKITIDWIQSEDVTEENVNDYLKDADGILVPGGFGDRG